MRTNATQLVPVSCAGSPFELGAMQGEQLRDRIRGCYDSLRNLDAFRLLQPRLLPFGIFRRFAEHKARRQWQRTIAPAARDMAERARGIAAGANMRVGSIHLLNVLEPMMADIREQTTVPPIGGCSTIAVDADRSGIGEPVIARNFDYLPLIQPFYSLRDTRPDHGLRSLDFTVAPLAGAVDGMNEAGLCIAYDYAYVVDRPGYAGPISMAIADALAQCTTVTQAAEFIGSRARWGGGLLMLADGSGEIAALELSNQSSGLRRPTPATRGVLCHSNRFQCDSMKSAELPSNARFADSAPLPLRGNTVHESAIARDRRFAELVAGDDELSPARLTTIMADHGVDGMPSKDTICMHSDYWTTTATLQFLPRSRRIRVALDSACRAQFIDFAVGASAPS